MAQERKVAFAIGAHPDDIEFMMAGTLFLLRDAGFDLHYMNVASGNCGTGSLPSEEIAGIRATEARTAAQFVGAEWHPSLVNDIGILYEKDLLSRVGAVMREVNPSILLVPSDEDYMEDHSNTARLAVTAAFCRGMRNFPTVPDRRPVSDDVAVYHALPYGLRNGMRRLIYPELYVDIIDVMDAKRDMLARHASQKDWLDASQGLDSYLKTMDDMSADVGAMSGRFRFAEGWRRHLHLGFSRSNDDPLSRVLAGYVFTDPRYHRMLNERPGETAWQRARRGWEPYLRPGRE